LLDIFSNDAFSVVSLTSSLEILPLRYNRLGEMRLFEEEGITTTKVGIEQNEGILSLIPMQPRGTMLEYKGTDVRTVRDLRVPHLPKNDSILADEVQNLRSFGSEDQLAAVSAVVNSKLARLKADHETTWEWLRACALRGLVVDANGSSVIYNLFTEFGVTETNVNFPVTVAGSVRTAVSTVLDSMELAMGSLTYSGITALCSTGFWSSFINSVDVQAAYERWQDGEFRRQNPNAPFEYGGISWMRYSATIGGTPYVPANKCRFFATGATGLFQVRYAPADFIETVNTPGKPYYAKQEPMPFGKGIMLHTQSNPLFFCTRPKTLIQGSIT
jgi:hypothetical protein